MSNTELETRATMNHYNRRNKKAIKKAHREIVVYVKDFRDFLKEELAKDKNANYSEHSYNTFKGVLSYLEAYKEIIFNELNNIIANMIYLDKLKETKFEELRQENDRLKVRLEAYEKALADAKKNYP